MARIPIARTDRPHRFPRRPCWPHPAAAIRLRWPSCGPAKPCSTRLRWRHRRVPLRQARGPGTKRVSLMTKRTKRVGQNGTKRVGQNVSTKRTKRVSLICAITQIRQTLIAADRPPAPPVWLGSPSSAGRVSSSVRSVATSRSRMSRSRTDAPSKWSGEAMTHSQYRRRKERPPS